MSKQSSRGVAWEGLRRRVRRRLMAVASTGAVTFYMLGKQNEKVETIQHQTNGTLSRLPEENARLTQQLV